MNLYIKKFNNEKSGFEDIPIIKKCNDPSHNPPSHLYIPVGKKYNHICPSCGKKCILHSSENYLKRKIT